MDASAAFGGDAASVGDARRFVRDALVRLDAAAYEYAAIQLVSELSTNAVIHARSPFEVSIEAWDDRLRLAVTDWSPRLPRTKHHSIGASTGRGLAIVAAMAADWGVERHAGGKTVWALLRSDTVADPALDAAAWDSVLGLEDLGSPTTRAHIVEEMGGSGDELRPGLVRSSPVTA
ncbi:MAG: ATP-binding protein [Actinomycetota bacterium]|nr:ATP-binding protein [Actinomycetota bacterium]